MHFFTLILVILVSIHVGADITVTDHIPVDDNPVYITMKRIDVNKNCAYETIKI